MCFLWGQNVFTEVEGIMRRDDREHRVDLGCVCVYACVCTGACICVPVCVCAGMCVGSNASLWLKLRSAGWVRVKLASESERKEKFPYRGKASTEGLRWEETVKCPWGLGGGWIPAGPKQEQLWSLKLAVVFSIVILLPWGLVQGPVMVLRPFSHFLQLVSLLFFQSTCIF